MFNNKKFDIGLSWAKAFNVWSQIGIIAGAINFCMMIGVFYTTTVRAKWDVPFWLYLMVIIVGIILAISFVLKWGISGYYRFLSKQSEISIINRKVDLLLEKNGIGEKELSDAGIEDKK
jgi:H+/Cl- antiporter ClcA